MEALYLLASLTTTLLTSTLHSLLLLLRLLIPFPRRPAQGGDAAAARLYEGRVRHSRRRPAAHAFEYPVRYALVELDRLPLPGHLSAADARRVASTSGPVFSSFALPTPPWSSSTVEFLEQVVLFGTCQTPAPEM